MKANTIKIEDPLLNELNKIRPSSQSFSAFVRLLLTKAVQREKMAGAAVEYTKLLAEQGEEQEWLDEWESADLSAPPAGKPPNKGSA